MREQYAKLAAALREGQPGFIRIDEGAPVTDARRGYVRAAVVVADTLTADDPKFPRDDFMRAAGLLGKGV